MGYYTTISINLTVKKEKIEAFHRRWDETKNSPDKGGWWFGYYDDLSLDEEGNIQFQENYRKWYDGDSFYDLIKEYVDYGDITGYGDSFEDYWRVVFDGNGNWKRQKVEFVDENSNP